jgi:hypothetical protein
MRHFLSTVRASMASSRRTTATPQDFVAALAAVRLTSSHFTPFTALPADAVSITQPAPRPAPPPAPDEAPPDTGALLAVLGSDLAADGPSAASGAGGRAGTGKKAGRRWFVPRQLPPFPSRHAWQATAVFAGRGDDEEAGKMALRERATEEGVLAERALRRLTGTTRKMRRGRAGSGGGGGDAAAAVSGLEIVLVEGEERQLTVRGKQDDGPERAWKAALRAAVELDEEAARVEREQAAALNAGFEDDDDEMLGNGHAAAAAAVPLAVLEDGASVNYDHRFWRDAASIF